MGLNEDKLMKLKSEAYDLVANLDYYKQQLSMKNQEIAKVMETIKKEVKKEDKK